MAAVGLGGDAAEDRGKKLFHGLCPSCVCCSVVLYTLSAFLRITLGQNAVFFHLFLSIKIQCVVYLPAQLAGWDRVGVEGADFVFLIVASELSAFGLPFELADLRDAVDGQGGCRGLRGFFAKQTHGQSPWCVVFRSCFVILLSAFLRIT